MTFISRHKSKLAIGGVLIVAAIVAYSYRPQVLRHPKAPTPVDVTSSLNMPEVERLRYFREINALEALQMLGLNGEGVRVTIMGEEVDAAHPDLSANVVNQYNAFARRNQVLRGEGNQPYGEALLGQNDGHGTHIAGTIAASCDGVGVQGVACEASLDVYDLGFYDSAGEQPSEDWGDTPVETRFLSGLTTALRHVTARGESRIITGSFNLEAPAVLTVPGGPVQGWSLEQILLGAEGQGFDPSSVAGILDTGIAVLQDPDDRAYLERIGKSLDDADMLKLAMVLTKTAEWAELETAMADYQATDGVYIVTESNTLMENRTSALNAMPNLSDKVDEGLWISVVMVARQIDDNGNLTGEYFTDINTCGLLAADYCLITPSYSVLSTMTERVAFQLSGPLFLIDGREHQVLDGHSMGAPMVAAALALMQQYNDQNQLGYSMRDMVGMLKTSANQSFPGFDPALHGRGMLDIGAALKMMGAALIGSSDFTTEPLGN